MRPNCKPYRNRKPFRRKFGGPAFRLSGRPLGTAKAPGAKIAQAIKELRVQAIAQRVMAALRSAGRGPSRGGDR